MTRTRTALLLAAVFLLSFAWRTFGQPPGFSGVFDSTNNSLRVTAIGGIPLSTFGTAFPTTGTAAGFRGASGGMASATIDNSGNLNVNCAVGCSGGGTSSVRTTSDSTLTATVTQNNVWNVRTTSDSTLTATVTVSNAVGIASNSSVNLAKVGNDTVVTGGTPGSQSVGGTAANNAAINQNPVLIGAEARAIGTYYASATSANQRQVAADQMGAQFVRSGGAIAWACSVNKQAAGYLQCQAPANQGFRLYVTDVIAQSSTSTAGVFSLAYGTGANCATGQTALFPGGTPTNTGFAYPANTVAPTVIRFETPLQPAAGTAICASGTATNTLNLYLSGFIAP